jgi:hypothetical protein
MLALEVMPPRDHQGALWPMPLNGGKRREKYIVHRRHGQAMSLSREGSPAALLRCMLLFLTVFLGDWRRHWARRAVRCVLAVAVGTLDSASTGVVFGCPMVRISAEPAPQAHLYPPLSCVVPSTSYIVH